MKKYEFTGKSKLTERALEVYNNSSFTRLEPMKLADL